MITPLSTWEGIWPNELCDILYRIKENIYGEERDRLRFEIIEENHGYKQSDECADRSREKIHLEEVLL